MYTIPKQVLTFKISEPKKYVNSSHMDEVFEILQSLRKYVVGDF